MNRRLLLFAVLVWLVPLGACRSRHNHIVVGSKNFTEQLLLGEIVAQHLERSTGLRVERRFYLAGTFICHQALLAGRIDLYVEYTGTALTAILKEPPLREHEEVYRRIKDAYARRFGLSVEKPLGFENSFAVVIRGDDARRLGVWTLSDAARYTPQWRVAVGYEFLERADGFKGMAQAYGLRFAEAPRVMDLGLIYRALKEKQVDMAVGSTTDGLIQALDLVVLKDDRHYFPPYDAVPIVRQQTLDQNVAIGTALSQLAGQITEEDMRRMNYAVDGLHRDAADVARAFLESKHFAAASGR
ncbi:MAG: glycine betaine ABC transporter substrate-binding protein [Terriglobales bacterium]